MAYSFLFVQALIHIPQGGHWLSLNEKTGHFFLFDNKRLLRVVLLNFSLCFDEYFLAYFGKYLTKIMILEMQVSLTPQAACLLSVFSEHFFFKYMDQGGLKFSGKIEDTIN